MDTEFMKYLAGLGVGGILAALFYYQNNKNAAEFAAHLKALYEEERGRTDMIVKAMVDSTAAITRNTAVAESLHRRLDIDNFEKAETANRRQNDSTRT